MKNINLQLYLELDFMLSKLQSPKVPISYYDRKLNLLSNLLNFNRRINLPIVSQLRKDI
jgi:hypothetical protein